MFVNQALCPSLLLLVSMIAFGQPPWSYGGEAKRVKSARKFEVRDGHFVLEGKPFQIICGEMHHPRILRACWRGGLATAKESRERRKLHRVSRALWVSPCETAWDCLQTVAAAG